MSDNTVDGWASPINAFVARLAQREVVPGGFDAFGIWPMRSALEQDGDIGESHVPAAAVWIIYVGVRLYPLSKEDGDESRAMMGGEKWTGKSSYCLERWQYWTREFEKMSENESFATATREFSNLAFVQMEYLNLMTRDVGIYDCSNMSPTCVCSYHNDSAQPPYIVIAALLSVLSHSEAQSVNYVGGLQERSKHQGR